MSGRRSGFLALVAVCSSALSLYGCGGGGGGGGGTPTGPPPVPTVTVSANPTSVPRGGSTQVTWSTTNATACTSTVGFDTTPRPLAGELSIGPIMDFTRFIMSCAGPGGSATAAVEITILPLPRVTLTLTPTIVRDGATSQLTWSADDATSCQASDGWSGAKGLSGAETIGPVTQSASYTLTCTGAGGSHTAGVFLSYRSGVNTPPTADAGPDQTVVSTQRVELLGSNSSDSHSIVAYEWTGEPQITLSNRNSSFATFTAPLVSSPITLTFGLTVTDDEGARSATDFIEIRVEPPPPEVPLSGRILYERVPIGLGGLEYLNQFYDELDAEVLIEALNEVGTVVASGRFARRYQLVVPGGANIRLRATAETTRQAPLPPPHWQVAVRNLDDAGAPLGPVYSYQSELFTSGAGGQVDFRIPNTGVGASDRAAAPFAILDSIQTGMALVLGQRPSAVLPPLNIDWHPSNPGGQTFFSTRATPVFITLAGELNVDTDEYDPAVILHEYGHYIDRMLARSDNLGGPHSIIERLDLRVAFGEGLASALSSIARRDPVFLDSFGLNQGQAGYFNVANDLTQNEGWYNESSVQELLWDLYDPASPLAIGFPTMFDILTGEHARTDAMVSIFTFMTALKAQRPGANFIDSLLAGEGVVGAGIDHYGSTETNDAGSNDVLPVYTSIALGGAIQLRSTNEFGVGNKLGSHRLARLVLPSATNVRINVSAAAGRDPDFRLFRRGDAFPIEMGPADESHALSLDAGEYILDVYDCGNADCNPGVPPAPTDITVSVTPN